MKNSESEIGSIALKGYTARRELFKEIGTTCLASSQAMIATGNENKKFKRKNASATKSCIHSESFSKDRVNDKRNGCIQTNASIEALNVHKWHKNMDVSIDRSEMSAFCCSSSTGGNQGKRVARCWQKQWKETDQKELQFNGRQVKPEARQQQQGKSQSQIGSRREEESTAAVYRIDDGILRLEGVEESADRDVADMSWLSNFNIQSAHGMLNDSVDFFAKEIEIVEGEPENVNEAKEELLMEAGMDLPKLSYANMIEMALVMFDELTLSQIYTWLEETFPHLKTMESNWKNSIRHTLSFNKKFQNSSRKTWSLQMQGAQKRRSKREIEMKERKGFRSEEIELDDEKENQESKTESINTEFGSIIEDIMNDRVATNVVTKVMSPLQPLGFTCQRILRSTKYCHPSPEPALSKAFNSP